MPTETENLGIAFNIDNGKFYIGDHIVEGIASLNMVNNVVNAAVYDTKDTLMSMIRELEGEIHHLKHQLNANLAREIAERCERFVNDRALTGMTDDEFEAELEKLLCG